MDNTEKKWDINRGMSFADLLDKSPEEQVDKLFGTLQTFTVNNRFKGGPDQGAELNDELRQLWRKFKDALEK